MARTAVLTLIFATAACASRGPVAPVGPAAGAEASADGPARESVAWLPDDSAADRAALEALDTLDFRSLGRRAGRIRGQVTAPAVSDEAVADEGVRLFHAPRGGAASATGPTYDIDVESFATHDRVQYYVDYFLGPARERFEIWLGRLHRYEGMIRQTLRVHGVPEDMVYLALIESGYSNTAVSRAWAVGMWQFMVHTGRRYGLQYDTWVDERRDPFEATVAAARHLADLNRQFGSWYLAAAAYNGGAGRVSRGIERLPAEVIDVSDGTFFALSDRRYLLRETRDYVPKLIAAALIAKDPVRYGFDSVVVLEPLAFDEILVTDATGLDVLADLADTTTRAMIELNPHFYRQVTPPGREVVVRVPRGAGARVARRWAELPAAERVRFVDHRIARGETLSRISRRYGVTVSLLLATNPGVEPRRLRVGQRLIIPVGGVARGTPPAAAGGVAVGWHTVRPGESLWKLSQRYRVSVDDLRRWNGIASNDVLRSGQRVRVSVPTDDALR